MPLEHIVTNNLNVIRFLRWWHIQYNSYRKESIGNIDRFNEIEIKGIKTCYVPNINKTNIKIEFATTLSESLMVTFVIFYWRIGR